MLRMPPTQAQVPTSAGQDLTLCVTGLAERVAKTDGDAFLAAVLFPLVDLCTQAEI